MLGRSYRELEQLTVHPDGASELAALGYAALERIARTGGPPRAVRHPLGFICLPVLREGLDGACLHLFNCELPTLYERKESALWGGPHRLRVHAHSWDLVSCVLLGHVRNLRMRVGEGESAHEPLFRVFSVNSRQDGMDEVAATARLLTCRLGAAEEHSANSIYHLPAGEFHATAVSGNQVAATLALGRTVPGTDDLVLGDVDNPGYRRFRQVCDAATTSRVARIALGRMDGCYRSHII